MPHLMSLKLMDPRRGGRDGTDFFGLYTARYWQPYCHRASCPDGRGTRRAFPHRVSTCGQLDTRISPLPTPQTPRCRTRGGSGTRVPSQLRSRRVTRRQSGSIYRSFRFLTYPFSHVTNRICAPQSPVKRYLCCARVPIDPLAIARPAPSPSSRPQFNFQCSFIYCALNAPEMRR
jgi:hypothetical protein